jgi:hypothetical protein
MHFSAGDPAAFRAAENSAAAPDKICPAGTRGVRFSDAFGCIEARRTD